MTDTVKNAARMSRRKYSLTFHLRHLHLGEDRNGRPTAHFWAVMADGRSFRCVAFAGPAQEIADNFPEESCVQAWGSFEENRFERDGEEVVQRRFHLYAARAPKVQSQEEEIPSRQAAKG